MKEYKVTKHTRCLYGRVFIPAGSVLQDVEFEDDTATAVFVLGPCSFVVTVRPDCLEPNNEEVE